MLDRLIDLDPKQTVDPPGNRSSSLREYRAAVKRDLEWLLNTRCHGDESVSDDAEIRRSVAFYGLTDIVSINPKSPAEQKRLARSLEASIKFFEPRFLDLKITLDPVDEVERQLKFRIEARLDVEPSPEPVIFDTVMSKGNGEFTVIER